MITLIDVVNIYSTNISFFWMTIVCFICVVVNLGCQLDRTWELRDMLLCESARYLLDSLTEGEGTIPEWKTPSIGTLAIKSCFLCLTSFPFWCVHLLHSNSCCYHPFWQPELRSFGISIWTESQQQAGNPWTSCV